MSWQIKLEGSVSVLVLDGETGIQSATEFHQAVLPLAVSGGPVRLDARAVKSVHTSIMQILYALSRAVPDFSVTEASEEFQSAEVHVGLSFDRDQVTPSPSTNLIRNS